jgi:trigger factor
MPIAQGPSYRLEPMSATVTTTLTELPESRVRVEAEVAPAEVERRMQQTAKKLGQSLRVDGFRKGKVPPTVVIRRLGREYVIDEAMRESLGAWYVDAIDDSGIAPIGEPDINVGDLPDAGNSLSFTIEVGVRPEASLGDYKGVEVGRREVAPSDEEIEAEIDRLRDRFATLDTVERAAADGDHVVMDYLGKVDGVAFEGGEGREQLLELGSGRLIPGFEEQLVGSKAGDEVLVNVTFPEPYGAEELAGKDATFEVKVSEVKAKTLPELTDEFAADAAGFDTMDELREDVVKRLTETAEHNIEHEFERDVLDAVAAGATIEVPHALVHARAHEMVHETMDNLARQGISKEMYLQITGQDEEAMANEAEEEAERSLRREAVLAAVVKAEKIEPTEEQLLEALAPSADGGKNKAEKLYKQLEKNGRLPRLINELAARQASEFLVEHAVAVAKVDEPEADEQTEEPEAEKPAKKPAAPKAAKAADAKPKTEKKPAAKKPAAKKPAAKKPAAKKPAAKKPAEDKAE